MSMQVLVADALADLEPQNILMPPRHVVELPELLTAGETEEEAQELYTRMCDAVGASLQKITLCRERSRLSSSSCPVHA